MTAPSSARARVRAELTAEIVDAAGQELADAGPAALSLRSVARRLGMVPSALYRYFPSRDSLLTALIIEAYEEVGAVAAAAVAATGNTPGRTARTDTATTGPTATLAPTPVGAAPNPTTMHRWLTVCRAVRAWAATHPQRWALIYGSPVPGYAAPEATVPAALRLTEVVAGLVREAAATGPVVLPPAPHLDPVVEPMRAVLLPGLAAEVQVAALLAWTSLIGMVSLELFGHFKGATTDFDQVFTYAMEVAGRTAGLA